MTTISNYSESITDSLLHFQYLEEILKMYLSRVYELINKRLSNVVSFKYSYGDVKKDSLSTLLNKFKKLSSNTSLINKINPLVEERNFVAHQAYLLTIEEQDNEQYLTVQRSRVEEATLKSKECIDELLKEIKGVESRLTK